MTTTATALASTLLVLAAQAPPAIAETTCAGPSPCFVEAAASSGLAVTHGYLDGTADTAPRRIASGVAAGDLNGDSFPDVVLLEGSLGSGRVLLSDGNGTFTDATNDSGVAITGEPSGLALVDLDGDSHLDLLVGGVHTTRPKVFRGLGNAQFEEIVGLGDSFGPRDVFSLVADDIDQDRDLDLVLARWGNSATPAGDHFWRNQESWSFEGADAATMIDIYDKSDYTFASSISDVDGNGWNDVLMVSDFETTTLLLNGGGTFSALQSDFTDQHGMGVAQGDYDGDGLVDFFVTSIYNPPAKTGNRLYRSLGNGTFVEESVTAGVRDGSWGWGACSADFDNDGWLDIFQVNGWYGASIYVNDTSRLFMNQQDGTFIERSAESNLSDPNQGRSVVCFDADLDGDVDILVSNNQQVSSYFRNDGPTANYLQIRLSDRAPNRHAIGAKVTVQAGGRSLVQQITTGGFASGHPAELHFGVGTEATVNVEVEWPGGSRTQHLAIPTNQRIKLERLIWDDFESGDTRHWSSTVPPNDQRVLAEESGISPDSKSQL